MCPRRMRCTCTHGRRTGRNFLKENLLTRHHQGSGYAFPGTFTELEEGLNGSKKRTYRDPESLEELPLVPGMSKLDCQLRWGFIKKVYGIISAQLVLTAAVASLILFVQPIQNFVTANLAFQLTFAFLPLLGLIPLYVYQRKHPVNLVILGLWTAALSVGVGTACTLYEPWVVLEALVLTATVVVGLTAYTFHAAHRGADFSVMGPMLFSGLLLMITWSFLQIVFPVGEVGRTVFALLGALIFSGYIILDTEALIHRFDLDQYVWASVSLYLDIINLFLKILQLLGRRQ